MSAFLVIFRELIVVIGDLPVLQGHLSYFSLNDFSPLFVLLAFRAKIRSDIAHSSKASESQHKQNQLIHEIADVLRRNIVQGKKLREDNGEPLYRKYLFFYGEGCL